ncbi:MAG: hypothetical protein F4Z00_14625 [Acidimicrobiaceae bacterium]|nr:hypothetical protein [Acidimicrobiaceae bacterium]MXZ66760.1 hypothetical protein [Acidimicrobiaceae bacterium]MYF32864.1 hypothetical protein [Acidimicrobiaceae bacterium]MYG77850.1 hypothetical protein [Acidimicrobiaceae bacterium]MYJ29071.1 hypothetical protein [Acidimicrobiaceae bacterium]
MATDAVKSQLISGGIPQELVDRLTGAFAEARHNHYLGGHRLAEVEGGRLCEAAYRILEHIVDGSYTPLGSWLDVGKLTRHLANQPVGSVSDSVRIHLPRVLRVIYDIRNSRDAAHLGDGIDPNTQDSSLVIACLNWVMAELVRLHHDVDADEAAALIDQLVERAVPVIQDFDGVPRVLRDLPAGDTCLLLLYQHGSKPMPVDDLRAVVRPTMRGNLNRTLQRLDDLNYAHMANGTIRITRVGERRVEQERLADDL